VLALPFVSGGLQGGLGDYSAAIKGSGSAKSITNTGVSIASTASYYGSGSYFDSGNYLSTPNVSDFQFGTGDFTMEAWTYSFSGSWSIVAAQGTTGDAGRTVFAISNTGQVVSQIGSQSLISSAGIATSAQWNHIAFVRKNGVGTIYLNGVSVGINTVYTNSIQNTTLYVGSDQGWTNTSSKMYIQDLRVYKSVAKYTGGFDVPRPYTPVGIATWRQVPDTTANNFATLNPLYQTDSRATTFINGNLKATSTTNDTVAQANVGVSTGKWYWETRVYNDEMVGIGADYGSIGQYPGQNVRGLSLHISGNIYIGGSTASYASARSANTYIIIGCALDVTNKRIYWSYNGTWQNSADPGAGTNGYNWSSVGLALTSTSYVPSWRVRSAGASEQVSVNFGQNPTFGDEVTAGTFTDSNGKGLFKYQPPSGFLALCEDNLPTPAISDPGEHFKTVLFRADGNPRSIVGVGFTPDLVWFKYRNAADNHVLVDSVRGVGKRIFSDLTNAELDTPTSLMSFDYDGFSIGTHGSINTANRDLVVWCWRAGAGTTSTNTNGSITSVVSVNQDAGFSIVSYTGTGSAGTVGHGLGKAPSFIIIKRRSGISDWAVYHKTIGTTGALLLNSTSATDTNRLPYWNDTVPTITTLGLGNGNNVNASSSNYIAYCWAEIEGFSKFGSYVGNGNADGPFIWTGFLPAWIMIKRTAGAADWVIHDSSRTSTNPSDTILRPNTSDIDLTASSLNIDFLSNGFKIRNTNASYNNAETYIFAAFAQSPFQTANSK
jgi:hypothetical protein